MLFLHILLLKLAFSEAQVPHECIESSVREIKESKTKGAQVEFTKDIFYPSVEGGRSYKIDSDGSCFLRVNIKKTPWGGFTKGKTYELIHVPKWEGKQNINAPIYFNVDGSINFFGEGGEFQIVCNITRTFDQPALSLGEVIGNVRDGSTSTKLLKLVSCKDRPKLPPLINLLLFLFSAEHDKK